VELLEPGRLPERYDSTGAVVPDWAMIPSRVYAASLAGDGHRTMTSCLESIAAWLSDGRADIDTFPWAQLRYSHTSAVRAALLRAVHSGRYAPATANKHLAALRGTLKAAWRMGQMTTDDYMRAKDLKPVPGSRLPAGRDVPLEELTAILGRFADDHSPGAVRDRAVISLAYFSGARRAELASLTLADLTTEPLTLRVLGKGNKERPVPLPDEAGAYLEPWLSLRGSSSGSLFCPVNRGTVHPEKSLTGEAIRQILQRRARAAGVAAVSPHDLRRTYAGDLLDSGADLPTVQRLLGHSSPTTTSKYDRRDERASRQAVGRLTLESRRDLMD
jgi:site-specific recombinase XerD